MTSESLSTFGELRRAFQGAGNIRLQNVGEFKTRFTLAQRSDGQLLFSADIARSIWDFSAEQTNIEGMFGKLTDGRSVKLVGPIFLKEANAIDEGDGTRLIGYPSSWIIGQREFAGQALITFELTNFLFLQYLRQL